MTYFFWSLESGSVTWIYLCLNHFFCYNFYPLQYFEIKKRWNYLRRGCVPKTHLLLRLPLLLKAISNYFHCNIQYIYMYLKIIFATISLEFNWIFPVFHLILTIVICIVNVMNVSENFNFSGQTVFYTNLFSRHVHKEKKIRGRGS